MQVAPLVPSGLPNLDRLPWGAHVAHFYRTPDDLVDILVPYFSAGLLNDEQCLWVTADPLRSEQARAALDASVPDLEERARSGQIEIIDHEQWYLRAGEMGAAEVLERWLAAEARALERGRAGLRLSGDTFWLDRKDWKSFCEYEASVHRAFHGRRLLALCSYSLERCTADDVVDVLRNHKFGIVRRDGRWEVVQSATTMLTAIEQQTKRAGAPPAAASHLVQFYEQDFPAGAIVEFIAPALKETAAVVIATPEHQREIADELSWIGWDVAALVEQRRLIQHDPRSLLSEIMNGGVPDPDRFHRAVTRIFDELGSKAEGARAYGELVDLLCGDNLPKAAVALEELWNDLLEERRISLLCGYPFARFDDQDGAFREICRAHAHVQSTGGGSNSREPSVGRLTVELQHATRALKSEAERRKRFQADAQAASRHLGTLQRVTAELSEIVSLADVARVATTAVMQLVGADRSLLVIAEGDGARLRPLAGSGSAPLESIVASAFESGSPVWLPTRDSIVERGRGLAVTIEGVESMSCHPLVSGTSRLGAIGFGFSAPQSFRANDRAFLDDAAKQLTLALERARLFEEARANQALLAGLVASAMDAIITTDASQRIILFNGAAERMFRCSGPQTLGGSLDRFLPKRSREELRKSGQMGTLMAVRSDGTEFPIEATISPVEVGGQRFFTVIIRDITDRLRAEEALREANRRKDEFLAVLGHELRNPLAPIMTALQLMKLRGDGGAERERAVIERQVRHVSRLVDDLLDVSRITRGKIDLRKEHMEAATIIARAIEMTGPLIEQRGHRLSVDVPREGLAVEADRVRISQAIANLLINAAKYTDPGGDITITGRRQGGSVLISVRDNGIGLRAEALQLIFEPFVQVQRTVERAQGGIGLGLWLVRSLVELHGGSIAARSDGPGWGSEFTIILPASASRVSTEAESSPSSANDEARSARRVLIVDDNPDAAESLAELLRAVGHEVRVAYDGPQALDQADAHTFDVAILDIGLPIMDGYELARRLREKVQHRMRFFALTGYGTEEDRARSKSSGFDAHFVKPFDHEQLLASIEERGAG